jgi:hypothetical protein
MTRNPLPRRLLPAFVLALAFGGAARADFVYTFNTTQAAPGAGATAGSLTVFDSAVESGAVTASDVDLFGFFLNNATSPFISLDFNSDTASVSFFGAGPILVDKQTGAFLNGDIVIILTDFVTQEQLQFQAAMASAYSVQTSAGYDADGQGTWTVQRVGDAAVPEPGSALLMTIASAFVAGGRVITSRRRTAR